MDKAEATCAKCGLIKGLCRSQKVDGVQQPHICKDCLLVSVRTGDDKINDLYWVRQMKELGDHESLVACLEVLTHQWMKDNPTQTPYGEQS